MHYRGLVLVLLLGWLAASGWAQVIGDSKATVLEKLGKPSMSRTNGDQEIWVYHNGTRLILVNGEVVQSNVSAPEGAEPAASAGELTPPKAANSPPRAVPSVRSAPASKPVRPMPSTVSAAEDKEPPPPPKKARTIRSGGAMVFIGLGALVILGCRIALIVCGFRESLIWGLVVIFVPLGPLIFTFTHWDEAKKPFLISCGGVALMLFAGLGFGAWS